jgi:hypothetical protein
MVVFSLTELVALAIMSWLGVDFTPKYRPEATD